MLDINQIQKILPHRFPFLYVDKILDLQPGVSAKGIKNVTMNEHFFQGHFPGHPVMPGVIIVEALAQVGAIVILSKEEHSNKIPLFGGINNCRFRKQVVPGDVLHLETEIVKLRGLLGKGNGKAYIDGQVVAEAEFLFAITEKSE